MRTGGFAMDDWDGFEMERRADGLCKILCLVGDWSMVYDFICIIYTDQVFVVNGLFIIWIQTWIH